MDKERRAETIIAMTQEALNSGNERLYWEVLGYVEGMRRSGVLDDKFATTLKRYIRGEWKEKRRNAREWFGKIWRLTA